MRPRGIPCVVWFQACSLSHADTNQHWEMKMELNEYAFLAAFLLPVGVLGAMNLMLALTGEAGTLLLPTLRDYPKVELEEGESPLAEPVRTTNAEAVNSEVELRKAA
jgi:hypothetical protein